MKCILCVSLCILSFQINARYIKIQSRHIKIQLRYIPKQPDTLRYTSDTSWIHCTTQVFVVLKLATTMCELTLIFPNSKRRCLTSILVSDNPYTFSAKTVSLSSRQASIEIIKFCIECLTCACGPSSSPHQMSLPGVLKCEHHWQGS